MAASTLKPVRCAIYTRKSTEHGLELEFNSLDAQRDACEAYIKSQASQGWRVLPQHYDDPAYSGGTLERPALRHLLADIESGLIDVIVVYKIDRLTRSLADFAKLVETFDRKSISFVAVTQQFNTTSSMGRLTLNVLLSFAQFERELASERVKDKVAASRRKGKWTGGTVPLGYDARDKKLVINPTEAETVRTIFKRYIELKSFGRLVQDLDRRGIVTKRRDTKAAKFRGGISFAYGPLAHFLKNRVYLGEVRHDGKWFAGEHEPILDPATFDQVQDILDRNRTTRKIRRSASGALLCGKLYDDRGNRMSPSFSVKNGIRYRFYISSAVLRGRKADAGSVSRIPAKLVEDIVTTTALERFAVDRNITPDQLRPIMDEAVTKIIVDLRTISIVIKQNIESGADTLEIIKIPWQAPVKPEPHQFPSQIDDNQVDTKLLQAVVRAHVWIRDLKSGKFSSIEDLAAATRLHPKAVRQNLRLAFLAPSIVTNLFDGRSPSSLADIPTLMPLNWTAQEKTIDS